MITAALTAYPEPNILLALLPQDIVNAGAQVGTASNQIILGCLLVVLIFCVVGLITVIIWLHKDNRRTILDFIARIDKKEEAMTTERRDRIVALMKLVEEDTIVKRDLQHSLESLKELIKAKL